MKHSSQEITRSLSVDPSSKRSTVLHTRFHEGCHRLRNASLRSVLKRLACASSAVQPRSSVKINSKASLRTELEHRSAPVFILGLRWNSSSSIPHGHRPASWSYLYESACSKMTQHPGSRHLRLQAVRTCCTHVPSRPSCIVATCADLRHAAEMTQPPGGLAFQL
jgi:hypothetical protein